MKLPRKLNYLEADIRSFLKQSIQRGKVDVFINYEDLSAKDVNVRLNEELGKEYYAALTKLGETLGIYSDVTALQIGRFPDVLSLEDVAVNQESIKEQLMKALSEAAGHFSDSREKEGENLKTDILAKLEGMKENVAFIEERYPSIVSEYRKKLEDKVAELLGDTNVDENRIAAEVVIYSDKICVDEETVRLKSHIDGMRDELLKGGNVGRKLDFIAQEMNREANTILSKANDIEVSDHAIDLKTEIEKIRGVSCSHAVSRLVDYNLVCELGRLDAPGRPLLFGTTEEFLRTFGVSSIEELPILNQDQLENFKREAEEEMQMKMDI